MNKTSNMRNILQDFRLGNKEKVQNSEYECERGMSMSSKV